MRQIRNEEGAREGATDEGRVTVRLSLPSDYDADRLEALLGRVFDAESDVLDWETDRYRAEPADAEAPEGDA